MRNGLGLSTRCRRIQPDGVVQLGEDKSVEFSVREKHETNFRGAGNKHQRWCKADRGRYRVQTKDAVRLMGQYT